jgi:hypothetical protein
MPDGPTARKIRSLINAENDRTDPAFEVQMAMQVSRERIDCPRRRIRQSLRLRRSERFNIHLYASISGANRAPTKNFVQTNSPALADASTSIAPTPPDVRGKGVSSAQLLWSAARSRRGISPPVRKRSVAACCEVRR